MTEKWLLTPEEIEQAFSIDDSAREVAAESAPVLCLSCGAVKNSCGELPCGH